MYKPNTLQLIGLAAALSVGSLSTVNVANAGTVFFGEDLNPGAVVPAGGNAETARNEFLSNLIGVGTETFDGLELTPANGLTLTFPGASTPITAGLVDPNPLGGSEISDVAAAGRFATSGSSYLQNVTSGFTLNFSAPVAAFGFYGTDIGDFDGQITLELAGSNPLQNFTVDNTINAPDGGLLFWGFIGGADETFSSVTFGNTNAGTDIFGFDDITIGDIGQVVTPPPTGVPAPATLALLGLGLLGLGRTRRRQK